MAGERTTGTGSPIIHQGDIYWISMDPTKGHEQRGRRPVLVISRTELNRHLNGLAVALPITSGGRFIEAKGLAVPLPETLQTKGKVLVCSPRQMDFIARDAEYIETVPDDFLQDILARHAALY